ncbi:MAG TPA: isoprenylcysteine carboxylmethyltransferase family protein [Pirellulales bacterium]|jgi:protein-S-isoprenylcysteine O-methyltransferase Ste14|nr:isoprenylcysteine carboxylmethyltransferase family protein [Pirellulales bacterium]
MSPLRLAAGALANVGIFAVCLFLPAPSVAWPRAWIFLGVDFGCALLSIASLQRASPELLKERFKSPLQPGQPAIDKLLVVLLIVAFIGLIVLIPTDVFRWHVFPPPPMLVSVAGLALFVAGWWLMVAAMRANAFAIGAVKLQSQRGHALADRGAYRVIRHPMYAGIVLLMIGMPLWLESYAAALATIVPTALLMLRIVFEERFLRRELPGYDAYTRRARRRLIPGIW